MTGDAQLLQARNIRGCDLALIVSYSGLTEEMIVCAREARLREAPVITISRFEQSPLVRLADYNLSVAATELIFRSGGHVIQDIPAEHDRYSVHGLCA